MMERKIEDEAQSEDSKLVHEVQTEIVNEENRFFSMQESGKKL